MLTQEEKTKIDAFVLRETQGKGRKVLNMLKYMKGEQPYLYVKFSDGEPRKIAFKRIETRDAACAAFAEHLA